MFVLRFSQQIENIVTNLRYVRTHTPAPTIPVLAYMLSAQHQPDVSTTEFKIVLLRFISAPNLDLEDC